MNHPAAQDWAPADQYTMDTTTDAFAGAEFIDFDNLHLDFNMDAYTTHGPASTANQLAHLTDSLHAHPLQPQFPPQLAPDYSNASNTAHEARNVGPHHGLSHSPNDFFDCSMPQHSEPPDQLYRPHQRVPPTPNSTELHADPGRYLHCVESHQAIFDQHHHMPKDDTTFTPLVSPAVTPHDARFQIPDFSMGGSYFSPLTSPALTAQNHQQAHQPSQPTTSGSSAGHSPIDVDMDMLGEPAMATQEHATRTRRTSTKRPMPRTNASTRLRQSPIVKPNRRKATVSSLIPPKDVTDLMQEARSQRPFANGLDAPHTRQSSETDSISPEPMLSEMRPPPKPASCTASPAVMAQRSSQSSTPATPASLMRIQPSSGFNGLEQAPPVLDDLTLPEASLDRPSLSRSDTAIYDADADADAHTPRLSARKTPKLNHLSTPGASMSGRPSPMLDAMSTPTSPAFSMTAGKKDTKLSRNPKKRNSVSSHLVSPALMPKISPSIKPLLPDGGGGATDNTHALLLASKSNYQNILDGTTVPGVVYPTSLSTNLTSKRTSHKIAEQGRRNRINTALQEMQALLPSSRFGSASDAKSPETGAQNSINSKAAKVESAIEYIKQLKQEVSERDDLLNKKDSEMDALRRELAELKRSRSESSAPEVTTEAATQPKAELSPSPTNGNET